MFPSSSLPRWKMRWCAGELSTRGRPPIWRSPSMSAGCWRFSWRSSTTTRSESGLSGGLVGPSGGIERQMKGGAPERIVDRPEPATMGIDDGPANGQPQAETASLGGEEGVADLIEPLRWNPGSAILHRQLNPTVRGHAGGNGQQPVVRRSPRHGITGVADQVQDDLLQLHPVSQ